MANLPGKMIKRIRDDALDFTFEIWGDQMIGTARAQSIYQKWLSVEGPKALVRGRTVQVSSAYGQMSKNKPEA